jgi:hypothetical protein
VVVERVVGDEQAFSADLRPATPEQRDATLAILAPPHADGEIWTTTKLLRRLAWHEPSELATMHTLAGS